MKDFNEGQNLIKGMTQNHHQLSGKVDTLNHMAAKIYCLIQNKLKDLCGISIPCLIGNTSFV